MSNIFKPVFTNENNNLLGSDIFTSLYTRGLWALGVGTLTTFHTSSAQSDSSKKYYTQVWMSASKNTPDNEMYSIAYGNVNGGGASFIDEAFKVSGQLADTPSRAIYSQYKLTCFHGDESTYLGGIIKQIGDFLPENRHKSINHFYAISFNRDKIGNRLDPGNFELNLAELNGGSYANNVFTGSNVEVSASNRIISLIDDSFDSMDNNYTFTTPVPMRGLVSGSLQNGPFIQYDPFSMVYYGYVFPEQGVILIDADMLNASASFNTVSGSNIDGQNTEKLFKSISGSAVIDEDKGFTARAVDVKSQQSVFIRVNSNEMNYSNNPTFTNTVLDGKLIFDSFRYNPYSYVTTIGLYNDANELLAVAKLSKPLQKSFNSEVSITVKLEY
jgi:hypothetical protein